MKRPQFRPPYALDARPLEARESNTLTPNERRRVKRRKALLQAPPV